MDVKAINFKSASPINIRRFKVACIILVFCFCFFHISFSAMVSVNIIQS